MWHNCLGHDFRAVGAMIRESLGSPPSVPLQTGHVGIVQGGLWSFSKMILCHFYYFEGTKYQNVLPCSQSKIFQNRLGIQSRTPVLTAMKLHPLRAELEVASYHLMAVHILGAKRV
jgi:hypothetical protein